MNKPDKTEEINETEYIDITVKAPNRVDQITQKVSNAINNGPDWNAFMIISTFIFLLITYAL